MTSTPPVVVRVPHPVQAGVAPAVLWILRRLLNLAFAIGLLWAITGAVTDYPANLLGWAGGILAVAVVQVVLSRVLVRAQRNRVPGGMRWYSQGETPRVSWVPDLVAELVGALVVLAVLPSLLARGDGYGILAGALALSSGAVCAEGVIRASIEGWHHLSGWGRSVAQNLALALPLTVVLAYGGSLAPGPHRTAVMFLVGAGVMIAGRVVEAVVRPAAQEFREGIDDAADVVLSRVNAAPTLRDRTRTRTATRIAVTVAAGAMVLGALWALGIF